MVEKTELMLKDQTNEMQVFENLEDYLEGCSKIVGIKLENLENLFVIFYCLLFAFLVAFLASNRTFNR